MEITSVGSEGRKSRPRNKPLAKTLLPRTANTCRPALIVTLTSEKDSWKQQTPTLGANPSLSTISGTFHSLFKVLFIFPSQYFSTIGLSSIFSFRWNLPPTWRCSPKQHDSLNTLRTFCCKKSHERDFHPVSCPLPWDFDLFTKLDAHRQTTILFFKKRFSWWALPASLAATEGIPVGFFSSA